MYLILNWKTPVWIEVIGFLYLPEASWQETWTPFLKDGYNKDFEIKSYFTYQDHSGCTNTVQRSGSNRTEGAGGSLSLIFEPEQVNIKLHDRTSETIH